MASKVQITPLSTGSVVAAEIQNRHDAAWSCHRLCLFIYAAVAEVIILILFALFTEYSDVAKGADGATGEDLKQYYAFFEDVNVMIFVGFGFLMTFLHKYAFSSVGLNFLVAGFCVQTAVLFSGLWERIWHETQHPGEGFDHPLQISIITMVKALFAAGAVLISMGACLGKTTPTQLLVMATVELFVYAINETVIAYYLRAVDIGGSMVIHTFGAYFGLAASRVISKATVVPEGGGKEVVVAHKDEKSSKTNDTIAMVGTLYLWIMWPSFNGALGVADNQHRAVMNTFFSLCACAVAAFAVDALCRPERKFNMVSIQNATIAGGVAMGAAADMSLQPWGAILTGLTAGSLSVVGYVFLQPALAKGFGLHDTCGVNNLHGMPGILGALVAIIASSVATVESGLYQSEAQIQILFPARAPCEVNSTSTLPCGLTAGQQASNQAAALAVTIALGLVGGIIGGAAMKLPCLLPPGTPKGSYCKCGEAVPREYWFEDSHYWHVEVEEGETSSDSEGDPARSPGHGYAAVPTTLQDASPTQKTSGRDESKSGSPSDNKVSAWAP